MSTTTSVARLMVAATVILLIGCDTEASDDASEAFATAANGETGLSPDHVRAGARLRTDMNGDNEIPGPGDEDGTGTASLTFNVGLQRVCYDINVTDIETPTMAHVHVAPAGVAGPIVVPLPVGDPKPTHFSGCVDDVERSLIMAIIRNPSEYYVNVHNAPFPAGAVRGQLGRG